MRLILLDQNAISNLALSPSNEWLEILGLLQSGVKNKKFFVLRRLKRLANRFIFHAQTASVSKICPKNFHAVTSLSFSGK